MLPYLWIKLLKIYYSVCSVQDEKRKLDDMQTRIKCLARCGEDLKTELTDERKTYASLKHDYEQKLLSLQREKFESESNYQQVS